MTGQERAALENEDTETVSKILTVAALFEGAFSIDWIQEITGEKVSEILNVLESWINTNRIDRLAPGLFRFRNRSFRSTLLDRISTVERESLYETSAKTLLKELPVDVEKCRAVTGLLMHVINDFAGCQLLFESGNDHRRKYQYKEAVQLFKKAIKDLERLKGSSAEHLLLEATLQYSKVSSATLETDDVISALNKAIKLAESGQYNAHWILLKMNLAKHEWLRSNMERAFDLFEEGWAAYQESDNVRLHRPVLVLSTFFHYWQGRYRECIDNYEKLSPEVDQFPNSEFPILTRSIIGCGYCYTGQVTYGLSILESLRRHCLKHGNIGLAGQICGAIADIYLRINQYDTAKQYLETCLSECTAHNNIYGKLAALLSLAYVYYRLKNTKEAVTFLKKFLALSNAIHIGLRFVPWMLELSWAMHQGLFPQIQGVSIETEISNAVNSRSIILRGIAFYFKALLEKSQGQTLGNTVSDLKKAVKWLETSGNEIDLAKVRLELARLYHFSGQYKIARQHVSAAAKLLLPISPEMIPDDLNTLLDNSYNPDKVLDEVMKLGKEMIDIRDIRELVVRIISSAIRVTGAERGALFLFDEKEGDLALKAAKNLTAEEMDTPAFQEINKVIKKAFYSGKGSAVDVMFEKYDEPEKRQRQPTCICVPLILREKVIGVLYIENHLFRRAFKKEAAKILDYFAALAAIALDNTQAYAALQELYQKQKKEKKYFEEQYLEDHNFENIVGKSRPIKRIFRQISSVAETDSTVLILGETGVGKELVAWAIHRRSKRKDGPFVRVNCSTFSESLISSELFGHEKGAFTGAISRQIGRFELAHEGTIFLDEIGDIPLDVQVRLLRVLQSKEFERVGGGQKTIYSNFRLMAATNRDLEGAIQAGRFRSDLYYRLNVFPIEVPPLRERVEDIPLLAYHFLKHYAKKYNRNVEKIPQEEMQKLMDYTWPGNVRELENVMERGLIVCQSSHFFVPKTSLSSSNSEYQSKDMSLDENERVHILRILKLTHGKIGGANGAANILKIHPNTLYSRMKKLGIVNLYKPT